MWTQLFSILTVIVAIVVIIKEFPSESRDVKFLGLFGLTIWVIGDITISLQIPYHEVAQLTLQSCSLSLVLVIYLKFIRQRKPIIFRYPHYMVYVPLLIPFTQLIVIDSRVIGEIIFMTLQGISIIVYILLTVGYSEELKNKLLTIIGVLLLLWGFTFYWILKEYFIVFEWAWGLINMGGMIACIYSFSDLLAINKTLKVHS